LSGAPLRPPPTSPLSPYTTLFRSSELGTVEGEPADDDPGLGDLLVEGHELARVRASGLSAVGVPAAAHKQKCVFHVCLPVISGVTPGGLTPLCRVSSVEIDSCGEESSADRSQRWRWSLRAASVSDPLTEG